MTDLPTHLIWISTHGRLSHQVTYEGPGKRAGSMP
jgi:hypothetical protein